MKRESIEIKDYIEKKLVGGVTEFWPAVPGIPKKLSCYKLPEACYPHRFYLEGANYCSFQEDLTTNAKAKKCLESVVGYYQRQGTSVPAFFKMKVGRVIFKCEFMHFAYNPKIRKLVAYYSCSSAGPVPKYDVPVFICVD